MRSHGFEAAARLHTLDLINCVVDRKITPEQLLAALRLAAVLAEDPADELSGRKVVGKRSASDAGLQLRAAKRQCVGPRIDWTCWSVHPPHKETLLSILAQRPQLCTPEVLSRVFALIMATPEPAKVIDYKYDARIDDVKEKDIDWHGLTPLAVAVVYDKRADGLRFAQSRCESVLRRRRSPGLDARKRKWICHNSPGATRLHTCADTFESQCNYVHWAHGSP